MNEIEKQELKQLIRDEATRIAKDEINKARTQASYGVSLIPYHTHNQIDSAPVQFLSLSDTPKTYNGKGGLYVAVTANENALEFKTGGSSSNPFTVTDGTSTITLEADNATANSITSDIELDIVSTGGDVHMTSDTASVQIEASSATSEVGVASGQDINLKAGLGGAAGVGNIYAVMDTETGTTSTRGFLFIPTVNGTPTGVPNPAPSTGVALLYDRSGNKLWVYDGGWVGVALT